MKNIIILFIILLVSMTVVGVVFGMFKKDNTVVIQKNNRAKQIQTLVKKDGGVVDINQDAKQQENINMTFVGDVILDRYTRQIGRQNGMEFFTKNIQENFQDKDVVIANFEGPITDNDSVSNVSQDSPNHFRFTFDKKQTKEFVQFNKMDTVTIGNNHILNFGEAGLMQTTEFLEQNNIDYIGVLEENVKNIVYKDINGKQIAFVAYNDFAPPSPEEMVKLVSQAKQNSDFVIVYPHWGQEYNKKTTQAQRDMSHMLVDAGADLIVGAHPHVIEPVEIYKNSVIFYSLGNFVFDQFFDNDVRERLLLNVMIDKNDKMHFVLIPLWTNKLGQLELADTQRRKKILQEIAQNSIVDDKIKQDVANGVFVKR